MAHRVHRLVSRFGAKMSRGRSSVPFIRHKSYCKPLQSLDYFSTRTSSTSPTHQAGHSHYENVRHIKAAKDEQKQLIINKLCQQIEIAVRQGGGNDPKHNSHLNAVLQKCKSENMPKATIDRALNKQQGQNEYLMCVEGPGGACFAIILRTTVVSSARQVVTSAIKKSGFNAMVGAHPTAFAKKRIVVISAILDDKTLTEDEATELAINMGAEDVKVLNLEEPLLELTCDEFGYTEVEKALEDATITILSSKFVYSSEHIVHPSESELTSMKLFLKIVHNRCIRHDAICEIVDIFHNVDEDFTTIFHA